MKYYSTRDKERKNAYSLKEAAFLGLAPDGGLFMPESIPQVNLDEVRRLAALSYPDLAIYLAGLFFGDDISSERLELMIRHAYDFDCPLRKLEEGKYVLELFHGPTAAFKDFGARFMGGMLSLLSDKDRKLTVLTATSGDTGSAVAAGFHKVKSINVVVLYPQGKVSPLQEAQMTTLGDNIHPVCVKGSFDDCQALVKAVFNDYTFRQSIDVTSANSINVLRWIPQSFYYFYAWAQWYAETGRKRPDIIVPSGNYGNLTAGMLAEAMGLPVHRFVAGANANSVIPDYLESGVYAPRPSIRTVANAMDVGAPSNYERMMYLYDNDFYKLNGKLSAYSYSDEWIKEAIRKIYKKYGFISDPHAAVGYLCLEATNAEGFYLATAHCAKFSEVIKEAIGHDVELPEQLAHLSGKEKSYIIMDNDCKALEQYIRKLVKKEA